VATSSHRRPASGNSLSVLIPRTSKRANVYDLSDADSDGSGETHFLLSPSDTGARSDAGEGDHTAAQPLPANATTTQYALDFDRTFLSNAPKGNYGHKDNWDDIVEECKSNITHAKLIKGMYGTPAPDPCERCASKGIACRVYHPDLQAPRATPGSCGECRLRSTTCIVNEGTRRKGGTKRKASEAAPDAAQPKILRRSLGGESARKADYCPVATCSRRAEPFTNSANFLRHVQAAHLDYIADGQDEQNVQHAEANSTTRGASSHPGRRVVGTFICPVLDSCPAVTRADNFRRHIRQKHPGSIHAQVLEAFVQKNRITLPLPPPGHEFAADFAKASSENVPPGAFGHRELSQWNSANPYVRTRIAHAKLIHGKYGIVAPESCANCRKRGTACMVYHPDLDGAGRALGAYCGECRDRSVKCEIGPRPFSKIIASAGVNDAEEEDDESGADTIAAQTGAVRNTTGGAHLERYGTDETLPGMKQEQNGTDDQAHTIVGFIQDDDSVMHGSDPGSPINRFYEDEEHHAGAGNEASRTDSVEGDTPAESAFYQYSKYVDQYGETING
jgi:hypothetical protein